MLKTILAFTIVVIPSSVLAVGMHAVDLPTQVKRIQAMPETKLEPWSDFKLGLAKSWLKEVHEQKVDKTVNDIQNKYLSTATDEEKAKFTKLAEEIRSLWDMIAVYDTQRNEAAEPRRSEIASIQKQLDKGRQNALEEIRAIRNAVMSRAYENVFIQGEKATAMKNGTSFELDFDMHTGRLEIKGTGQEFAVSIPSGAGLKGKNAFPDGQPALAPVENLKIKLSSRFDMSGDANQFFWMTKANGMGMGTSDLSGIIDEYFVEAFRGSYDSNTISDQADKLIDTISERHFAP